MNRVPLAFVLGLALLGLAPPTAQAQVPRTSQGTLSSEGFLQASSTAPSDLPWTWLPLQLQTSLVPIGPLGSNDGAAWQGKGANVRVSGGFRTGWLDWELALEPQISFAQNEPFALFPSTRNGGFGDYSGGLDRYQRPGNQSQTLVDPGNSEVRFTWEPWTIGFGTESLWFGPGRENAILISDNAAGLPHLDLGLRRPWSTSWGTWEGRVVWGQESNELGDTKRLFHALFLSYRPSFLPELTVGFGRTFASPWETINAFKLFQSFVDGFWKIDRGQYNGLNGNDDVDQLVSVALRVDYPESGFSAWAELARNDHSRDLRDFLAQPDHSAGYVAGLSKSWLAVAGGRLSLSYEQADLGLNYGTVIRPTGSWYRHSADQTGSSAMGYTQKGQLLGAQLGPGSNQQTLRGVWEGSEGVWTGLTLDRLAKDVDYLVKGVKPASQGFEYYDVQVKGLVQFGFDWFQVQWVIEGGWVHENNRYWKPGNDQDGPLFTLHAAWRPAP